MVTFHHAVYGVGMWIAERYAEGLPYIIFAQNKYREHIRPRELEKEQFNEGPSTLPRNVPSCNNKTRSLEWSHSTRDLFQFVPAFS